MMEKHDWPKALNDTRGIGREAHAEVVPHLSGRRGQVRRRDMLTKLPDDEVGWLVPFHPNFDPSMLKSAYYY